MLDELKKINREIRLVNHEKKEITTALAHKAARFLEYSVLVKRLRDSDCFVSDDLQLHKVARMAGFIYIGNFKDDYDLKLFAKNREGMYQLIKKGHISIKDNKLIPNNNVQLTHNLQHAMSLFHVRKGDSVESHDIQSSWG